MPNLQGVEVIDSSSFQQTHYRIFFIDSVIMYQSEYFFDSTARVVTMNSAQGQPRMSDSVLLSDRRNQYFVYHQDSVYGYNFDLLRLNNHKVRVKVDSAKGLIEGRNRWDTFLLVKPDTTFWDVNYTQLKETFNFPFKQGSPSGRLNLYYSNQLSHLKASFNLIVDSAKKMKLFKTETLLDEFLNEKDQQRWPALRIVSEMKEITIKNISEIRMYIDLYKKIIADKR